MPLYEYKCQNCGTEIAEYFSIGDRPQTMVCTVCGGTMGKMFSVPQVQPDWEPHFSFQLGGFVNSRKGAMKLAAERGLQIGGNNDFKYDSWEQMAADVHGKQLKKDVEKAILDSHERLTQSEEYRNKAIKEQAEHREKADKFLEENKVADRNVSGETIEIKNKGVISGN